MALLDVFSKRDMVLPEVFTEDISQGLRNQLGWILKDTHDIVLKTNRRIASVLYPQICMRWQERDLPRQPSFNSNDKDYFECFRGNIEANLSSHYKLLPIDIIEKYIQWVPSCFQDLGPDSKKQLLCLLDRVIEDLNDVFKENGSCYRFENNQIIKITSTTTYENIIKPAIKLTYNEKFAVVNDYYMLAHEYYKKSDNEKCILECCRAAESTLCILLNKQPIKKDSTSKQYGKLVDELCTNYDIPQYSKDHLNEFSDFKGKLKKIIKTLTDSDIRGKEAHGSETGPIKATYALVQYVMNLTGSNIIFLIESYHSGIFK